MPLVAGAIVFSCEQNELDEVSPAFSEASGSAALSSNLLHNETFEGSTAFEGLHDQFGTDHAFRVVTSPVFEGAKSGRFELRDSDPETSSGTRSEVLFPDQTHRERWYSFRAFYPASGYKDDRNNDILNQWHQGSGTGSPLASLRVENGRFLMKVGPTKDTRKDYDLGVQTKDTWHEFVFHFIHSTSSEGLVEVWHNGTKVLTYKGGNMYDAKLPRWKVGIYKDDWNGSETTDTNLRIFYLDNIRMGNENATLADMSTATSTTTEPAPIAPITEPAPAPATEGVTSFKLIDAATEKEVLTITDGATISLSKLANRKLNIRAITNPITVGSVKFALSGTQSKSYTDNAAPYALHGDSGSGNYYYGNWNPPATGTYTLTATPYSGTDGSGTKGAPLTIKFTITK
jgi:hypothetical protein